MTGSALQFTYTKLLRTSARKKVVMLVTTGKSRDDIRRPSLMLRRLQVETFTVGVGRGYSFSELAYIASDRSHVLTAGFRNLNTLVGIFRKKICKGECLKPCELPSVDFTPGSFFFTHRVSQSKSQTYKQTK